MSRFFALVIVVFLVLTLSYRALGATAMESCADTAATLSKWRGVFSERNSADADALARQLLPCLGSTNPELRDTLGYGLYSWWLRNDRLSSQSKRLLTASLTENLSPPSENPLLRSFSALILAELLRADASAEFLDGKRRQQLLEHAATALREENDFRGLDPQLGWVHPIAHLADVMWRFALHPALDPDSARAILRAVHGKATTSDHAYRFNEPDRLARPVALLIRRQAVPEQELLNWLDSLATPASVNNWNGAFGSVAGMTELHNSKLFIRALSDQLREAEIPDQLRTSLARLVALFTELV